MAKQLLINSVKINSSNNISLPYKEFSKGFNIICGSNEAGKSSMMNFLKECFHNPAGLLGDIELLADDTKYQIKVEGTHRTVSKRLKLLAPVDKTLEDIIPKIDESFYKRAFTINLDDVKNIDIKLFDIIQDHNANKIRLSKNKLDTETKAFLTEGGKAAKDFTQIVNGIKKLDKTISELIQKEKDYNNISNSLKSTELDITELIKKINNKKQVQQNEEIIANIETIKTKIASLVPNFNQKLSDNKQLFYDINNRTALIIKNIEELNELNSSTLNTKIEELIANIERDYNLKLDSTSIKNIDISREFETQLRSLQAELNNQELLIKELVNKKDLTIKALDTYEQELADLKDEMDNIAISNHLKFKEGLQELRDAISSLADITSTVPAKNTKFANIIYAIASIILIGSGIYLHNTQGIIMGAIGTLIIIPTIKEILTPHHSNDSEKIYNYIKKEIFPKLNREETCLQTVSALSSIANIEDAKLKDYERALKEWEKKVSEQKDVKLEKTELENSIDLATETLTSINSKIKSLATIQDLTFSIDIIFELINDIKEARELITKFNIEQERKQLLKQEVDIFIKQFYEFLESVSLDTSININSLANNVQTILSAIENNEKLKHEIETLSKDLLNLESKLNNTKIEDLSPEQTLQELEVELNNLNINLGSIKEKKKDLEDFEGIIAIQNEKNVLKTQLQNIIKETFKKKLAINIIKHAEKEIRQTEPNLVNAEHLLKLLTNSKYISADYATRTICSANGESKTENELSRGTREQLYLAFRLGYAQNYGSDGTNYRLPLIIDDAFVNFDKERLTNALKALKEFAKTNQVLFFTCHKDYITSLINTQDVNIIEL